jgi:hypothetical protein
MMPAAPLVGAVTTRPPAAFSSLTASAYRLTQSSTVSGSRSAASGLPDNSACSDGRAPRHMQAAGQGAGPRGAARHAGLHHVPARAARRGRDDVGIDPVRPVAFQAHQHRLVGAVAAAGQGQRAEHLGAHPGDIVQAAGFGQVMFDETRRRAHRPDRVRGARADADLVQVEGGDGHGGALRGGNGPLF